MISTEILQPVNTVKEKEYPLKNKAEKKDPKRLVYNIFGNRSPRLLYDLLNHSL